MKYSSEVFKSAEITPALFKYLNKGPNPGRPYGFFLMDGKLVPNSLIDRIEDQLSGFTFDSNTVWDVEALFSDEFWNSLDCLEKSVAGACILVMIENGFTWEKQPPTN
jgi:hypothetical protein